jgi:flagellin
MTINSNMTAMTTTRMLKERYESMNKKAEKLNSGRRVNRAGDDSAGLAISEKMRAQIRGLNKAMQNTQDAINMVDTAEGALQETHAMLQRMRELSVRSANETNTDSDREKLQLEVDELIEEIDKIADTTHFNTKQLIDGKYKKGFNFLVGANQGDIYGLVLNNMNSASLGVGGLDLSTQNTANNAIKTLDDAIEKVGEERAKIGATHNRLDYTLQNIRMEHDNMADSESRIRDADMAREVTGYTADKIIMQTGIAVQAHANTTANNVLKLIGA